MSIRCILRTYLFRFLTPFGVYIQALWANDLSLLEQLIQYSNVYLIDTIQSLYDPRSVYLVYGKLYRCLTISHVQQNLYFASNFMVTQGYSIGSTTFLDDWLKRDRFVFLGWSGLILFPTAYVSLGAWFITTSFITS